VLFVRVSQRVMGGKRKTARRPTSPKSACRKLEEKVFQRLGVDSRSQSSRAQRRAGDERDAKRAACLRENFKDNKEIPKFLTVPRSEWCANPPPLSIRASGFRSSWLFAGGASCASSR
jgi:hypothetical protein